MVKTLKASRRNGEDRACVLVYFHRGKRGGWGSDLPWMYLYFQEDLQILKEKF